MATSIPTEPATQAGRALLYIHGEAMREPVLAIEAEAVAPWREAVIWMSGSDDFAPADGPMKGGKARKGYEKIVLPLLRDLLGDGK